LGDTQTLDPEDAPLCLHAWRLAFDHPLSGKRLVFETARPDWAGV
jgi:23S rRNA-/tRNA-specific pseudouridylate synthase